MTDQDKVAFAQAFNRLCVALREKEPDAVQMRVYFEGLKALELEFIVAAGDALAMSAAWFPKLPEWRAAAAKVETDRVDQQRAILRKLKEPLCRQCDDHGWARNAAGAVSPCACRHERRLEVLGRRPMPLLPESTSESLINVNAIAVKLAAGKGF